jgi:hypothetical protein
MFALPNLPREWYFKLKELCEGLGLTQWQVVILGFAAIVELGQHDEAKLRELAADVKSRYSKGKRSESMERG